MAKKKTPTKTTRSRKTKTASRASTSPKRSPKKKAAKKKTSAKTGSAPKKTVKDEKSAENKKVTIDRRRKSDRRREEAGKEPHVAKTTVAKKPPLERRKKVNRRRQIDPTTCERDYSNSEIEFMNALEDYKRKSGRMFPTCSEVLEVIRAIGYVQLTPAELAARQSNLAEETTETPSNPIPSAIEGTPDEHPTPVLDDMSVY